MNLADFCRSQDGLQTALHEGGSNLSGGQRQRLAMARALLHDTPIYLFDEATSNVDAESENDIMAAIRSLAGRKTVILISHRLANVVDSDCIYVLDKGRIANLRMAKPDAAEAELWAALEQVNLADFCRSQDGLQTALHEGGSNLSGGQRQRLAMARALLHDTPIYLFDEATSNVDAESENDIMAAIRSLAGRKTVILISHRLANVVDSDCIYVLDKGRIAERGTHAELLKKQGAYSRLYTAQKQLETLETEDA